MAERYTRVFTLNSNLYAKGSPVIILAGALLHDTQTEDIIAQLKFSSVINKEIVSISIRIFPRDIASRSLGEPVTFSYLDLKIQQGEVFGSKIPVKMPENTTREFAVEVFEVVFSDKTVWCGSNDTWEAIPNQTELSTEFDSHVIDSFKSDFGISAQYKHLEYKDLLFCVCGAVNNSNQAECYCCKTKLNTIISLDYNEYANQKIYESALSSSKSENVDSILDALSIFEDLSKCRDCSKEIDFCNSEIDRLNRLAEEKRIQQEKEAESERKEAERIAKRNKKIAIITTPIICAIIAFIIVLNTVIIPNGKYNYAIELMDAGKYTEAIAMFKELDNYKKSVTKIGDCNTAILDEKYCNAIVLMESENYKEAIDIFGQISDYKDSVQQIIECKYLMASKLSSTDSVIVAYETFIELGNYKDSIESSNLIYKKYMYEKYHEVEIGDSITFGKHEMDENDSNGKEAIEWLVLAKEENRILLLSKFALEDRPYHSIDVDSPFQSKKYGVVTWEVSNIRAWLNNTFFENAFCENEKNLIIDTTVTADKNEHYNVSQGKNTIDKVYLLSTDELTRYFNDKKQRYCYYYNSIYSPSWWTRTMGKDYHGIKCVSTCLSEGLITTSTGDYTIDDATGDISYWGENCDDEFTAVRPALWIDLGGGV